MTIHQGLLANLVDDIGMFRLELVLHHLNISGEKLASLLALDGCNDIETFINTEPHKTIMKQSVALIDKVDEWCSSKANAIDWFISEPIPALGNVTPRNAVLSGNYKALNEYIDAIALGGYA